MKHLHLDSVEATEIAGVQWKPVRASLGIEAFGINAYVAGPGEHVVEPHDELGSNAGGHDELYVVVAGRATFTVAGEELDAPAITFVLVKPDEHREATAVEEGTTVLAIGGKPGEAYKVSQWEYSFRAYREHKLGRDERARELIGEGLELFPGDGGLLYGLACYESLTGDHEAALGHLREAAAVEPRVREWALDDDDLAAIRDDPRFAEALGSTPA